MLLLVLHRRELVDSVDEKMISQYNEIQQREKRVGSAIVACEPGGKQDF